MLDKLAPSEAITGGGASNGAFGAFNSELPEFVFDDSVHELTKYESFELIGRIDAHISKLMALRARAIVAAVGEEPVRADSVLGNTDLSLEDLRSTELAAYLRISPLAARTMAETARGLVRWLPRTLRALEVGNIDEAKARVMADGANRLYSNLCIAEPSIKDLKDERVLALMQRYETLITRKLASRTKSEIRQMVKKAIAHLTPLGEDKRHQIAKEDRCVDFIEVGDGMTMLQATMTNLDAAKVKNVLEYCAKNDPSLKGTMQQRMSDVVVGIFKGESEISAERRFAASQVNVVVELDTLLGLSDAPATLIGHDFALTASQVRELAETSNLRRMVVDSSTGALLELGRKVYEPTKQQKDFVKMRDQKCRAPGCERNAMRCDIDHIRAWDDGGETNVSNLAALCRRHHILKTIGEWKYELLPNGDTVWTLPDGHVIIDYAQNWVDETKSTKRRRNLPKTDPVLAA